MASDHRDTGHDYTEVSRRNAASARRRARVASWRRLVSSRTPIWRIAILVTIVGLVFVGTPQRAQAVEIENGELGGTVVLRIGDPFWEIVTSASGTFAPYGGARTLPGDPKTFLLPITQADASGNWAALGSGFTITVNGVTSTLGDFSDFYYMNPAFDVLDGVYFGTTHAFCQFLYVSLAAIPAPHQGMYALGFGPITITRAELERHIECLVVTGSLPPGPAYYDIIDIGYNDEDAALAHYYLLPPAQAGADSATTAEDTPTTINVLANDRTTNGGALTSVIVSNPANGTAQVNADGTITYTPAANFNGTDSFTYKAQNELVQSLPSTVTVTVSPVNDTPTIAVVPGGQCRGDTSGQLNLALNDVDGDSLTLTPASSNTKLVPNRNLILGDSGANRTLTITTADARTGTAVVTLTASDGQVTAETTITVKAGANGIDTLNGTSGADLLLGQNGNDTLNGSGGNDLLCGSNGDDRLNGGEGDDTLLGQSGADGFDGGAGTDTATDFTASQGDTKTNIP
jgi:Ca2+-binding RTX toxin-like protein